MAKRTVPRGSIRRGQLIAPFGVGAMMVMEGGTSLITAGLDNWYRREEGEQEDLDLDEFIVREWRLERELQVSHFRLPPDDRKKGWKGRPVKNWGLTIPALRFPRWHFCRECNLMIEHPLSAREDPICPECRRNKRKDTDVVQVPLIALCEHGHIQDFPWREWVHRGNSTCNGRLRLVATGGATLAGTQVHCECNAKRSLGGAIGELTNPDPEAEGKLQCSGQKVWLGITDGEPCDAVLRGSLRSASNVYFAQIRSAIYLPQETADAPQELIEILSEPRPSGLIHYANELRAKMNPDKLREMGYEIRLSPYTDEQILAAANVILGQTPASVDEFEPVPSDDRETHFRRAEYMVLQNERSDENLSIRGIHLEEYDPDIRKYFGRIMLLDKLRETRALVGFTRVHGDVDVEPRQLKQLLWRNKPRDEWLPANIVYGEGIFLQLNEQRIQNWEQDAEERIALLSSRYDVARQQRSLRQRRLTPRFVLLHTLAHVLINQLVFECGYSSASLRERLYVSDDPMKPMAGILIYTAAGDSEGTMGGLVRMGRPGFFEPIFKRALEETRWCSSDPICMEIAEQAGQGPDSCNLAACHSCALLPETACEELNRFLDRAVLIGDLTNPKLGFFNQ